MKRSAFPSLILTILFVGVSWSYGSETQHVVETLKCGTINWTEGMIQAPGMTVPFKKDAAKSIDREVALTAAKASAGHHLFETIKMIRVNSRAMIGTLNGEKENVPLKLNAMVRNAKITKQKYLSDGTLEITMQLSMLGGFSQLVLPTEIKQLETIKQMKPVGNDSSSIVKVPQATAGRKKEDIYSGLIIDTKGFGVQAALVPKVLDENGREVYGPAFASREFAVQSGMSGYVTDMDAARNSVRVGSHPLLVKGLSTEGPGKSNIVISDADAARLRGASEHLRFLRECRVVIVIYPKSVQN